MGTENFYKNASGYSIITYTKVKQRSASITQELPQNVTFYATRCQTESFTVQIKGLKILRTILLNLIQNS